MFKEIFSFGNAEKSDFYFDDVLTLQELLREKYSEKVKLIYLDPPFMTGRNYDAVMPVGAKGFSGDRKYYASLPVYSDIWESKDAYLTFLKSILLLAKDLLNKQGVLVLHVDRHMSAYARILLDEIFGENCFLNEIIWHYHSGGSSKKAFSAKHDNLYIYGKTPRVSLNPAAAGGKRSENRHNHMKKQVGEDGRIFYSIKSNGKEYRYYEDDVVPFDDVWDIPHLQQKHPERTGYGTQKPLELLDRIVRSCSEKGDLVCDFFSGSGTTLISALKNGRAFLGTEMSPIGLLTLKRRLIEEKNANVTIYYPRGIKIVSGYENIVQGDYSLLPQYEDKTEYLNYVALGKLEDETFICEKCSIRTNKEIHLNMELLSTDDRALWATDVWGNNIIAEKWN